MSKNPLKPKPKRPLSDYWQPPATRLLAELVASFPTKQRPALAYKLNEAISIFARLFNVGEFAPYFVTPAEKPDKSGCAIWPHSRFPITHRTGLCVGQSFIPPQITRPMLLRHLLQGRELRWFLCHWLHLEGGDETDRFAIDIDAKKEEQKPKAKKVFKIVTDTFGPPEFAVTSRRGRGFNLWYFLAPDAHGQATFPTKGVKKMVCARLAEKGLVVNQDYEFFPVIGSAFPAIPYGGNMKPLDPDGNVIDLPSERALLEWYHGYCQRGRAVSRVPMPTGVKSIKPQLPVLLPAKATAPEDAAPSEPMPWYRRPYKVREVEPCFKLLDKSGLTGPSQRRDAQRLLKHYTQGVLCLSVKDSIGWAIEWVAEHHNEVSENYNQSPEGVFNDIKEFFTNRPFNCFAKCKSKPAEEALAVPSPLLISVADFKRAVEYILAWSKAVTKASADGKKSPARFRKGLLSFMVHSFAYARGKGEDGAPVSIPKTEMHKWAECSRDYRMYRDFLRHYNLATPHPRQWMKMQNSRLQFEFMWKPSGEPVELSLDQKQPTAWTFRKLCDSYLGPHKHLFFGEYQRRKHPKG